MKKLVLLFILTLLTACNETSKELDAEAIVAHAIEAAGGKTIDTALISFKFRDKFYSADRNNGRFKLERCTDPGCKDTLDQLSNSDFKRFINETEVVVPDSLITSLSGGVNSVHYFSVLPYGLDAEAVHAEKVGQASINGKTYFEIKVTFSEEGGGEDFEDTYMYWINTEDFSVDFLAYNYHVNEGGTRFREAYNERTINGVRFVDYRNFKPQEQFPPLQSLDSLFTTGNLELLSKIDLEQVEVNPCSSC
ncbi:MULTISPECIES: DUF6503 family protein [Leeuwenhoekiella]|jgi:hypothetical protein|uniref:DUF6503 family protein n=1 Tax=Leeuwenhoekiella TaxID=283735 RepID=UPI000C61E58C|nr:MULTISPECIES: DUF6503 family protein [Leeuwenhoekiella]MAO44504.1 deoxyribose-phosphate aldolase [Leeuwenhoekiella sp.]|tara:strand:+ start:1480 stop:2229 length:750 start_codon:yes stop_codon:yes gene_type:complete